MSLMCNLQQMYHLEYCTVWGIPLFSAWRGPRQPPSWPLLHESVSLPDPILRALPLDLRATDALWAYYEISHGILALNCKSSNNLFLGVFSSALLSVSFRPAAQTQVCFKSQQSASYSIHSRISVTRGYM